MSKPREIIHATRGDTLADVVERILDKGIVINADITVSLVGTELLSIRIRAAVASFETAAKWGLAFPSESRIGRQMALATEPMKSILP